MRAIELIRRARAEGWTATPTGGGHLRFEHREAGGPVFTAATPSDSRWAANTLSQMKRALPRSERKPKPERPALRRRAKPRSVPKPVTIVRAPEPPPSPPEPPRRPRLPGGPSE